MFARRKEHRLSLFLLASFAVFGPFFAASAEPPVGNERNPAAVQEAAAGTRTTANAAWWGFDRADSTKSLQSAIDSGAPTVVVPYMGDPWIVTPIKLRSNLELVFEPGVLVLAKEGEFKGKGDSLFGAVNANDVTVRGYGATLRMRKGDYQKPPYEKAEWRTTLDFTGCRRVRVEGVRLESSGGDGIYIGATAELPYCADVVIRDVVCDSHHRQGISVITAVNLLIENCVLSNTGGTAPQAGIDLEPNLPNEKLVNCIIRNCVMEGNTGAGILLYLNPLARTSDPVSILFENCRVRGNKDAGIAVAALKDDGPAGLIEFRNCIVEDSGKAGLYVANKSVKAARVRFVNCTWRNAWAAADGQEGTPRSPLLIALGQPKATAQQGGIEFVDCCVYDTVDRPALVVEGPKDAPGISDLKGTITVRTPHAARAELGPNPSDVSLNVRKSAE